MSTSVLAAGYELVHATRPKCCSDGIHNSHTCVDVADELRLPLAGICAFFKQNDLWLLQAAHAYDHIADHSKAGCSSIALLEAAMTYHHPMRHDGHLYKKPCRPFSQQL